MSSQSSQIAHGVTAGPLWGPRYPPRWILPFIAVMTLLTVASAVFAVQGFGRAPAAETGMCLLFAALFGHLIGYAVYLRWVPLRRGPAMPETDSSGTGFGYAKWGYYWYVAPIALAVLGLASFALMSFDNGIGRAVFAAVILVFCLVVTVSVAFMVYLAPGRLTLTPDGLHHRGLTFVQYSPWTSIVTVDAIESGHERAILVDVEPGDEDRIRHYLPKGLRSVHPLLPGFVVTDTWLLTDPTLVHETLRHYLDNPGDRPELGTKAAVDRIRHRRFTTG
ncbi:hypothetical protein [Actinoplanes derwentensis]|uniref:PH domain-containing protein n=1 Tax=Actinoplanes derwentensis TaxID=113562 RepID=A0A1H1QRV2_9ACTN|nr:hypothetical protein [Actinoplanes derwentensis]GID89348.1 hypothetical protein Ade03nite_82720 [Actinoplanes derwentensis]SDS26208.1 hypothetical protein SAMN04489716_0382 [Actinoplanes derwentensis]